MKKSKPVFDIMKAGGGLPYYSVVLKAKNGKILFQSRYYGRKSQAEYAAKCLVEIVAGNIMAGGKERRPWL